MIYYRRKSQIVLFMLGSLPQGKLLISYLQVCPVEESWVAPLLDKIHNVDVARLSKGAAVEAKEAAGTAEVLEPQTVEQMLHRRNDASKVDAAKERFLARKKARMR